MNIYAIRHQPQTQKNSNVLDGLFDVGQWFVKKFDTKEWEEREVAKQNANVQNDQLLQETIRIGRAFNEDKVISDVEKLKKIIELSKKHQQSTDEWEKRLEEKEKMKQRILSKRAFIDNLTKTAQ